MIIVPLKTLLGFVRDVNVRFSYPSSTDSMTLSLKFVFLYFQILPFWIVIPRANSVCGGTLFSLCSSVYPSVCNVLVLAGVFNKHC